MISKETVKNIELAIDSMLTFEETVDYDFLYVYAEGQIYGDDDYDLIAMDTSVEVVSKLTNVPLEWSHSECTKGMYYGQWIIPKATSLGKVKEVSSSLLKLSGVTEVKLCRLGTYGHEEVFTRGDK